MNDTNDFYTEKTTLKDYILNKPTVQSERLVIRPFAPNDEQDLKEWTPNREIYRYWGKNPSATDKNPELLLEKKEKPSKSFHLYIEHKKDKKVIGDIYIYLIEKDVRAKVAIRLNPEYHNRGYGTEAVKTMCQWCFSHTELQTIWTDVEKENVASVKMLEKCGFEKTKEVQNGKMVSVICNYFVFELTKAKNMV